MIIIIILNKLSGIWEGAALHEWPLEDPDTFRRVQACVSGHLGKVGAGSHTLKGLGLHALQARHWF